MATYKRALTIATEAHFGQTDKAGADYILHPIRVSNAVDGEAAKIVALLHDVVEDCPCWSLERLREESFGDEIIAAIDAVTRRAEESYEAFVRRAASHPLGRIVKIADLRDNMDHSRLTDVTAEDEERLARYARALDMIGATASSAPTP